MAERQSLKECLVWKPPSEKTQIPGKPRPHVGRELQRREQEPRAVPVEDAWCGMTFGGGTAEPQPRAFQKASSACKSPDTGWLPQPGWETGEQMLPLPSRCGQHVWEVTRPLLSQQAGERSIAAPVQGGRARRCGGGCLFTPPLLPAHRSLSTHLPVLVLTLVSPDLTHLCSPGGLRLISSVQCSVVSDSLRRHGL